MRNTLFITAILIFSFNTVVFADTLNAEMIAFVHQKMKGSLINMCKHKISPVFNVSCDCIAEKGSDYLNDDMLSQCNADQSGTACTEQAVHDAVEKAVSASNLQACAIEQQPDLEPAAPTVSETDSSVIKY